MSCIVGVKDYKNKSVIIGADSASSSSEQIMTVTDESSKVFDKEGFLFGCTTSFRMTQLLRYSLKIPLVPDNLDDFNEYICTDFINSVRDCFKQGGFAETSDKRQELGGQFLLGYKSLLYIIDEDYQVNSACDGFEAVGCGAYYALGSLYTTQGNDNAEDRVFSALYASEYFNPFVRRPFIIKSTK